MVQQRLQRSKNRVVAGVCGGIAQYAGIDPVFVRLAFVLLTFAGGTGLLLYIVLMIVMPESDEPATATPLAAARGREVLGALLVVLGGLWLIANLTPYAIEWRFVWPLALVAMGVLLLARRAQR